MKLLPEVNESVRAKTAKLCRERGIVIPTLAEQKDPAKIPEKIKQRLKGVNLGDLNPVNLFRITWKNKVETGLFGDVNCLEFPPALTGVPARLVGLVGKYFPTGAHKVGAAFGCLVPRLVTGAFDPTTQKAVWPSTGNYCRGGAFDCALLACTAVAILPERMSRERFEWLQGIGAEVIATPGCESNVKEIYDQCWEIKKTRKDCVIFNQFEEFGNCLWHYEVTGTALHELYYQRKDNGTRVAAYVSATGSAGTIGAGDYLKRHFPDCRVVASEAVQCPTLYLNGFGDHRIEGIGDKHVPWIHNVRNTDAVVAIDDEACMALLRVFNEPEGKQFLASQGLQEEFLAQLPLLGISSIGNLLSAVKTAKYYELNGKDLVFFPLTDSAGMYGSRLEELQAERGAFSGGLAGRHWDRYLQGAGTDYFRELSFRDRKALHHLKYYTWVEQQQRTLEDLNQLWEPETWEEIFSQGPEIDRRIREFNELAWG